MTSPPKLFKLVADFVLTNDVTIPESAMQMAATLLVDTLGVAAGAVKMDSGVIPRNYVADFMTAGSDEFEAAMLFDGRKVSQTGAAYALATQIDNLDAHDGYNPVKGHIGCAAVPALFAFAQNETSFKTRDALKAMVISYEIAARAGMALHATTSDYHTSGAWNALGVAALGCHFYQTNSTIFREALGIAEYLGPRSQMMREIANPSMLHDGSGMGAMIGIQATHMARRHFTGAPAITVENEEVSHFWKDLGEHWTIEENYIKPYPICRWAHAAIDATRNIMLANEFTVLDIKKLTVRTFNEAAQLFRSIPKTTSEAQYSLPFSIAIMLNYGQILSSHISGEGLKDENVAKVLLLIEVEESEKHNDRFPSGRWSDVSISLHDGRVFHSGDTSARGAAENPLSSNEIEEKFFSLTKGTLSEQRTKLIWENHLQLMEPDMLWSSFAEHIYPAI